MSAIVDSVNTLSLNQQQQQQQQQPSGSSDYDILLIFRCFIQQNVALPVAAMTALVTKIKKSKATTWMELEQELRSCISQLKSANIEDLGGRTNISLGSGCDLFMKYVTRAFSLEDVEFKVCKDELLRRGERFANMSMAARNHIAEVGQSFIQENSTILIHGVSRVVKTLILKAAEKNKVFNLVITEGRPNVITKEEIQIFLDAGIPTSIVADSAIGLMIEDVDMVLVGAEGVMENGGIINKVGTYQIALVASALKKPFYVAVESYKFARMYPLSQKDSIQLTKSPSPLVACTSSNSSGNNGSSSASANGGGEETPVQIEKKDMPSVDFTPAKLITLLFTDLGVLTPAAVSDELIKLYQ